MILEHALFRTPEAAGSHVDFNGVWHNAARSSLELVAEGDKLRGTYTSAVSASGGPMIGELLGFVNSHLISFTVRWPSAAITAWVGRHRVDHDQPTIDTLWHMTTMGADQDSGFWHSILAGADHFTRTVSDSLTDKRPGELEQFALAGVGRGAGRPPEDLP